MKKITVLVAMLAMMMVAAAPAFAQGKGGGGGNGGGQGSQGQERVEVTTPSGNTIEVAKPAAENAAAFNGGQQGGGNGGGNDGGQQGGGNGGGNGGGQNAEGANFEDAEISGTATGGSVEATDSNVAFCQNIAQQTIANAPTAAVSQDANAEQTNTITDTDGDAEINAGDVTAENMVELGGVDASVDQHCQATVNQAVAVIKH